MISRTDFLRACKRARRSQPELAYGGMGLGIGLGLSHLQGRSGGRAISALDAGFQPNRDLGVDGDLFLDFDNGSDSNNGLTAATPVKTITKWLTLNPAGKTTRVRGFVRGAFNLTDLGGSLGAPTRILGWGADKGTVSAADQFSTGWTQCTSPTDDSELGATLAATGKVWKKTGIAIASFVGSKPISANLFQSGQKLNIATAKNVHTVNQDIDYATPNWLVSPTTTTSGSSPAVIVSYLLPSDLQGKGFTSGQMTDVTVLQHVGGNLSFANTVSGFSAETVTMTISNANTSYAGGTDPYPDSFALLNFLPEMRSGEWGYRITGGGTTVTLYVWPHDAALGASMVIDYSARGYGVKMGGTGCNPALNSYFEIGGLIIERQSSAGADTDENTAISFGGVPTGSVGANHRTTINIHDCLIQDTWRLGRSYGQVWGQYADKVTFQRNTLRKTINSFGCFFQGDPFYGYQCDGLRFMDNVLEEVTNSCLRMMAQKNVVIARNRFINSCGGDHANQLNPYVISKDVLIYGNILQGNTGYLTWGDSNPPDMLFNYIDGSHTKATPSVVDARGIVDQNNNKPGDILTQGMSRSAWNTATGGNVNPQAPPCWYENSPVIAVMACNQVTPNSLNTSSTYEGMALGITDADAVAAYTGYFKYRAVNNVANGITWATGASSTGDPWVDACLSNVSTNGSSSITGLTAVDGSNRFVANSSEYTDVSTNEWSAPVGAVRRTKSGITMQSIESDIAALKLRFADVASMLDYDCAGRLYDKSNPPVGPFTNVDDMPAYRPFFWTAPSLTGTVNVGETLGVNLPVVSGYPKPTFGYQWNKLTNPRDSASAAAIIGATSATSPVWVLGDVGAYPGVGLTPANSAGSRSALVVSNNAVVNVAYPISDPITAGTLKVRATASAVNTTQTNSITTTGKPLVVVIGSYNSTASVWINWTVTINGNAMTLKAPTSLIRGNFQVAVFFYTGLVAGTYSLSATPDANYNSFSMQAIEIDGATDLSPYGTAAVGTVSKIKPTITTSTDNGGVLYVSVRGGGDLVANPISMTYGEAIVGGAPWASGTNSSSDHAITVAYEKAAVHGGFDAEFYWGASTPVRSAAAIAMFVAP